MTPDATIPTQNTLGEGPIYHKTRNSIFWTDILEDKIFELHLSTNQIVTYPMPAKVGTITIDKWDNLLLALQGQIAFFNLQNKEVNWLCDLEKEKPFNRPNDGKIGPDGNLWLGTMEVDCKIGEGAFYCIDKVGNRKRVLSDLSIPNGLAWAPNETIFYHIDSPDYSVKSYFFDAKKSEITFQNVALQFSENNGMPDGMAIDQEGMLWIAFWGGFCVQCWNPKTGQLLDTITLPAPQITSCAFGGKNLDQLFITSARAGMSIADLDKYPESGNLFIKKMEVKGINSFKFGGNL